jgi:hypothetical protein
MKIETAIQALLFADRYNATIIGQNNWVHCH